MHVAYLFYNIFHPVLISDFWCWESQIFRCHDTVLKMMRFYNMIQLGLLSVSLMASEVLEYHQVAFHISLCNHQVWKYLFSGLSDSFGAKSLWVKPKWGCSQEGKEGCRVQTPKSWAANLKIPAAYPWGYLHAPKMSCSLPAPDISNTLNMCLLYHSCSLDYS